MDKCVFSAKKGTVVLCLGTCLFVSAVNWLLFKEEATLLLMGISGDAGYWTVGIFVVGALGSMTATSKLTDRCGERPVFAIATVIIVMSSITCVAVSDPIMFLVLRCMQGVGFGMIFIVSFSSIGILFPNGKRWLPMSFMVFMFAMGSMLGLAVGHVLAENGSIAMYYYVASSLLEFIAVLCIFLIPSRRGTGQFDLMGCLFMTVIIIVAAYAIEATMSYSGLTIIDLAILAIVMIDILPLLVVTEKYADDTMFPMGFNGIVLKSLFIMFMIGMLGIGFIQCMFKMIMIYYNYDVPATMVVMIPLFVSALVMSLIGSKNVTKLGLKPWAVAGAFFMVIGFVTFSQFADDGLSYVLASLAVTGLGIGCMIAEVLCMSQSISRKSHMATSTANIMGLFAIGIAMGNALFSMYIVSKLNRLFARYGFSKSGDANAVINDIIANYPPDVVGNSILVYSSAVMDCALIAACGFVFVELVIFFIRRTDLENAKLIDSEEKN